MTTYHVFTNNQDEWFNNLAEAEELFNEWAGENGCARLYEEEREEDGELINENCINAIGSYPM